MCRARSAIDPYPTAVMDGRTSLISRCLDDSLMLAVFVYRCKGWSYLCKLYKGYIQLHICLCWNDIQRW